MKAVIISLTLLFVSSLSIGAENIYWTDFYNSTVNNGRLIKIGESRGYATAKSQQLIHRMSGWEINYTVELDQKSKIWGIVKAGGDASLEEMDFGFYLSNSEENRMTIFYMGRPLKSYDIVDVSHIKLESLEGELKVYLDNDIVYSISLSTEYNYNLMGMVEEFARLGRLTFSSDYNKVFNYSINPYEESTELRINLPNNYPSGPYHYLLGRNGFVNLNSIYNKMQNYIPGDSSFFDPKYNSKSHKFYLSETGRFFASVLDENLNTIAQEEINILPKIEPLSTSAFSLEGKHYIAGSDNSFCDLPVYLDLERSNQEIMFEISDINTDQIIGFGADNSILRSIDQISMGCRIRNGVVETIINGIVENSLEIVKGDYISIIYNKKNLEFVFLLNQTKIGSGQLREGVVEKIRGNRYNYNLKLGIEKAGVFLNPIRIRFPFRLFDLATKAMHLECGEENTGIISMSPTANLSSFYQLDYYSLALYDENNNQVGTGNQTYWSNLSPGSYTISGSIGVSTNPPFNINLVFYVNKTIDVGYLADWITKDIGYIEDPNSYSVLVQGHDEQSFLQARSSNYLKYIEDGWVKYKPIIPYQFGTEIMRYETSNLGASAGQLGIFNEDWLAHHKYSGDSYIQLYSSISGYSPITSLSSNDEIKIMFSTNSTITNSQYGENEVFINNNSYTIYPRTNSNLSVIPNSILNGSGYENVITSFGCPTSEDIYGHLKYELDGFYHTMKDGKINFVFDQEYAGENLQFNIYNSLDQIVKTQADFPSVSTSYGKNYITLDVSTVAYCIGKGFFYLETINSKGEKKYLRFYNDFFVDGCALDNLEYEENNPTE